MSVPERANDRNAVQMFLAEARLAASLDHQYVAQVFEVGEQDGVHFLAMEYVHGQDLRAVLARAGDLGRRVPLELALTAVAGAASGLHHAHERRGADGQPLGIVHRDVTPSNIVIGYDGAVKLLDFGIAKATARSAETQNGIIKGKFAYLAPEQCRGRDVDRRGDVFALGIVLYEATTQHRCFRAESDFDTMQRIVLGQVVRPSKLVADYPQALEAIVIKALATDPPQRYQTAAALLEALESFAASSRMSLSVTSLARFMRDLFGEQPEPWIASPGTATDLVARETTISNTDGSGHGLVTEGDELEDAATILRVPTADVVEDEPKPPGPKEWNAKSYPPLRVLDDPSGAVEAMPPVRRSERLAAAPQPVATAESAGSVPDAGNAPRSPTRPPTASEVVQLTRSGTPFWIAAAVVAIGAVGVLAFRILRHDAAPALTAGAPVVMARTAAADQGDVDSVSLRVTSTPEGADVVVAGKVIGTTPVELTRKRMPGRSTITVHKAGYRDVTTEIDLGEDYKAEIRLVTLDAER